MVAKAKWFLKEAQLRIKYMTSIECLFCKIVKGEIESNFLKESDKVVVFADINPVADVHILIVPKKHIESVSTIKNEDSDYLVDMFAVASRLAADKKLDAYRLSFNAGRYQHVGHLHMHLLGGEKIQGSKL